MYLKKSVKTRRCKRGVGVARMLRYNFCTMNSTARHIPVLFLAAAAAGLSICACSNDGDKEMIREFKVSFLDFIEGRDEYALLRYVPDEIGDLGITMYSSKEQFVPGSLDDLEMAFEEVAGEFQGDSVSVLQTNETHSAGAVILTWTVKVVEGCMERTLPVRVDLVKEGEQERWVMVGLALFR